MLIRPCGDQTQLSSFWPGGFTYLPSITLVRHSTREKLTRHSSPAAGRETEAREANAVHGNAISTIQPRSVSRGSLSVPFTETAVRNPCSSIAGGYNGAQHIGQGRLKGTAHVGEA